MNPSYSFTRFAYLVAGVLGCHFVSLSGTGATFDAAADFATNRNPNGAWSYGYSTTLGGSVTQFPDSGNWAGLNYWRSPVLLGVPGVYHNPANSTVTNSAGAAVHGPGGLTSYPGPNGEFSVIRFTAPDNGEYQISGAFSGVDPLGTASPVYVLVNGVTFYGFVNGYGAGSGPTFNLLVDLALGHSIDFVVGRGADSQFRFNSTGVAVQINGPTGEPPGGVTNMLLNVNFGAHLSPGLETNKVGLGAVGRSANDVWNFYSRDIAFREWRLNGALPMLTEANGEVTAVGLVVSNAPGAWANGSSDAMYNSYIYPFSGTATITVTNLPAGRYDFYLYANDGNYQLSAGGTDYGTQTALDASPTGMPVWQEGVQYAWFANVAVTEAGQAVTITVRPGVYGYAIISGLQIAQSGGTGAEMPTVSNRKTISMFREPGLTTRLRFAGIAGRSYVVQASTNLKNWEAVATVVADTSGVCAFEDQDAIRFSSRYYRIVVP